MEEYIAAGRTPSWLARQVLSIVGRRRSHLTISESGAEMLSNVRNDIHYALRTLRHNPGFALAAIVPIALGIGINTGPLLPPQQPCVAADASPGRRGARDRLSGLPWRTAADGARCAQPALDPRIPRLSRRGAHAHRTDGLLERVDRHPGSRIRAGNRRHPRHLQLLRRAQSPAGHRHRLHAGQLRHARRAACRGVESRALADRLRQRSASPPQAGAPERTRGHRCRRRPGRVRRRGHGEGSVLRADVDGGRVSTGAEFSRRRACELADAGRPAARRRDVGTGAGGSLRGRGPHRSAAAGPHDLADRRTGSHSVASRRAAEHTQRSGHRHGGVRAGAADRRRQRRQHAARARGGSDQGDRHPVVGRRNTRPPRSATADRKRHHRAGGRGVRLPALLVVVPGADSMAARVGSWRGGGKSRRHAGCHGALVCARTDGGDGPRLRSGPGASRLEERHPRRDEARRRAREGQARLAARDADRRADCALHDAADPGGAVVAGAVCRAHARNRIRAPQRDGDLDRPSWCALREWKRRSLSPGVARARAAPCPESRASRSRAAFR